MANVGVLTGSGTAKIAIAVEAGLASAFVAIGDFVDEAFGIEMAVIGDVARQSHSRRGASALKSIAIVSSIAPTAVSAGVRVISALGIRIAISQYGAVIRQWTTVLPVAGEASFTPATRKRRSRLVIRFHLTKRRRFVAI